MRVRGGHGVRLVGSVVGEALAAVVVGAVAGLVVGGRPAPGAARAVGHRGADRGRRARRGRADGGGRRRSPRSAVPSWSPASRSRSPCAGPAGRGRERASDSAGSCSGWPWCSPRSSPSTGPARTRPERLVLAGPALVGLAAGQLLVWAHRGLAGRAGLASGSRLGVLLGVRRALSADHRPVLRALVAAGTVVAAATCAVSATDAWAEDAARIGNGGPLRVEMPGTDALQTLLLTEDLDPEGRWLMAGGRHRRARRGGQAGRVARPVALRPRPRRPPGGDAGRPVRPRGRIARRAAGPAGHRCRPGRGGRLEGDHRPLPRRRRHRVGGLRHRTETPVDDCSAVLRGHRRRVVDRCGRDPAPPGRHRSDLGAALARGRRGRPPGGRHRSRTDAARREPRARRHERRRHRRPASTARGRRRACCPPPARRGRPGRRPVRRPRGRGRIGARGRQRGPGSRRHSAVGARRTGGGRRRGAAGLATRGPAAQRPRARGGTGRPRHRGGGLRPRAARPARRSPPPVRRPRPRAGRPAAARCRRGCQAHRPTRRDGTAVGRRRRDHARRRMGGDRGRGRGDGSRATRSDRPAVRRRALVDPCSRRSRSARAWVQAVGVLVAARRPSARASSLRPSPPGSADDDAADGAAWAEVARPPLGDQPRDDGARRLGCGARTDVPAGGDRQLRAHPARRGARLRHRPQLAGQHRRWHRPPDGSWTRPPTR